MPGYKAVPAALRKGATEISEAATAWGAATEAVRTATLGANDYGLLGQGLVRVYNQVRDRMANELKTGTDRITTAATHLNNAATGYEQLDYNYYRKFGYLRQ